MTGNRLLVHTVFLLLLPLLVAWFGLGFAAALGLVVLALLWRWMISLSTFAAPTRAPELVLETISASHYVEKVRWCMDLLGLDYVEKPAAGTLTAFYTGRTVPLLKFRTGAVQSSIGNSSEILRYLWGRYAAERGDRAKFLEADEERLALEARLDRCGTSLQVWVYHHILPDPELALHAWGCDNREIPLWQRLTIRALFPVQAFLIRRAFRITDERHAKAVVQIDTMLEETEEKLKDGRKSILGGDQPNFTDYTFAALMGLWLQPPQFGGGKADSVRIEREDAPKAMRDEIERWESRYPLSTEFILTLYRENRPRTGLESVPASAPL